MATDTASPSAATGVDEYVLPCVEALFAGTLALMTGLAEAPGGGERSAPMAAKIAANLALLADHPSLSVPMRAMLLRLVTRWQPPGGGAAADCALSQKTSERALWLKSPALLQ